jgi:hypothetical protein
MKPVPVTVENNMLVRMSMPSSSMVPGNLARYFDGSDTIAVAPGNGGLADIDGSELTIAWIWKPDTVHAGGLIFADANGDFTGRVWSVNEFSDGNTWLGAGSASATGTYQAGKWQLNACATTVAGTDRRSHRYDYDTQEWTHADPGSNITAGVGPVVGIRFGRFAASATEFLRGVLAVVGVWDSFLTDEQIEGLSDNLAGWEALSPVGLWTFNQASTDIPVTDLTGGDADETAIVGTSVVAGPPAFRY